jgi:hypothetical protein
MTQYNTKSVWRHIAEPIDNMKTVKDYKYALDEIAFNYREIEKVSSIGIPITDPSNERSENFAVCAMQGIEEKLVEHDWRYKELQKWIIAENTPEECSIYGSWCDAVTKKHAHFKGMLLSSEVDDRFKKTKYTLVIPIKKNWITAKYHEMIVTGCLPFFHADYDAQHLVLPADHILRCATPADLKKKMAFFNKHPEERIKLVKQLQEKWLGDVTNGHFLARTLNDANKEHQIDIQFDNPVFKQKKENKLNAFFN